VKERADREGNGVVTKSNRGTTSASDRKLSRVLRLGVAVLVVGAMGFSYMYYQDQHIDAGPSLIGRQTLAAEAAVKKAPNNIQARLALAASYRSVNRLDDALGQYSEILKSQKSNRFALLGQGESLITKGDLKAAKASYTKITSAQRKGEFAGADPQLEEAYYYLGTIAVKQGNAKVAITQLAAALKIDRADSDAYYQMGLAQLKAGAPQLGVEAFNKALEFVPTGWCEPYSQLSVAYGTLHQAPQSTYATGMANFCNKKPAEAKRQLTTLVTLKGPVAVNALLGLGLIAETESKNPEAISWYKKVLLVDRTNVTAISSLSRLGVGPKSSSTTQGPS
jgi:tetratricopeptide (TPR) repeat protein